MLLVQFESALIHFASLLSHTAASARWEELLTILEPFQRFPNRLFRTVAEEQTVKTVVRYHYLDSSLLITTSLKLF
jgi:hypothetical protein